MNYQIRRAIERYIQANGQQDTASSAATCTMKLSSNAARASLSKFYVSRWQELRIGCRISCLEPMGM